MANIAAIFHWPPSAMADMDLPELMRWNEKARARSGAEDK